ncbi:TfoX/Sxy family protein [Gordonia sp. CPCC 206044]|uniref:TfoX/Sxy family protein n=1 Tax=Gordonia sp. CPCC 206044 TaxID=3140793 RepID=UPI003AF3A049
MTYDDGLAFRIRGMLAEECGVDERSMFGGLAFLINGNMAVAASDQGGLMVRVPPEETEVLLEFEHTTPMTVADRQPSGWLQISDDGIRTERQLQRWVTLGAAYARKLPPK